MNYENYFKDMFGSIPDYRKKVFSIKDDDDLLEECGFLKSDINHLIKEFKSILMEQNEEYLDHIKNQEEIIIKKILNKQMEQYFSNLFEDIRYERAIILLLSIVEPDKLKQSKFTDNEVSIIKDIALKKIFRQQNFKQYVALDLLEKQFSN